MKAYLLLAMGPLMHIIRGRRLPAARSLRRRHWRRARARRSRSCSTTRCTSSSRRGSACRRSACRSRRSASSATIVKKLAAAQTPLLLMLVGLKFKLAGNTPVVCVVLLLARAGVLLLIADAAIRLAGPESIKQRRPRLTLRHHAAGGRLGRRLEPDRQGRVARGAGAPSRSDRVRVRHRRLLVPDLDRARPPPRAAPRWHVPNIAPIGSAYVLAAVALFGVFRRADPGRARLPRHRQGLAHGARARGTATGRSRRGGLAHDTWRARARAPRRRHVRIAQVYTLGQGARARARLAAAAA